MCKLKKKQLYINNVLYVIETFFPKKMTSSNLKWLQPDTLVI